VTEVGTVVPERQFQVTRTDLVRYAGASGDFNPIHWSGRVAGAVGLPGVIAHGMLTMALAARLLTDWAGDPAAVVEYGVRFARPVVVPDDDEGVTVTVSGTVTELRGDGLVGIDVNVRVGEERVLTQARALVRPPNHG
jgi:acyl dehydratase